MTFDPRVSEWDNPAAWRAVIHTSVVWRRTEGTETS